MKLRALRAAILDDLALGWLGAPGRGWNQARFLATHDLPALALGRALVRLRDTGLVRSSAPGAGETR